MKLFDLFSIFSLNALSSRMKINQGDEQKALWRLVWSDEFEGSGSPNPANWSHELGFVRNQEQQYYTDSLKNAHVKNGCLVIEAHKERCKNSAYEANSDDWRKKEFAEYTSASLTTRYSASWLYGRVEIRAKIPAGAGSWPAIWMLGCNIDKVSWPACGEIDILENWGQTHTWSNPEQVFATIHYKDPDSAKSNAHTSLGGHLDAQNPADGFHLYAMEWNEEKIDFYYDSSKYFSVSLDELKTAGDPFHKPFYLLINLALENGVLLDDSLFPLRYQIDYVRIYERMR